MSFVESEKRQSMRATIALYDAYAGFEGCGRALLDIADRLDPSRFEPGVTFTRDGELLAVARQRGHRVAIVEPPSRLLQYDQALVSGGWSSGPATGLAVYRYARKLRRWFRANEVRLLHCNQTRATLQAGLGGKLAGIPVVWGVRIQQRLPTLARRFAHWCSDAVAPIAASCLDGLCESDGLRDRVTEIPLGVDCRVFGPTTGSASAPPDIPAGEGRPVVVMVGCLHPRKRHDLLIEATPLIAREVPDVRVVIVGGTVEDMGDEYLNTLLQRRAELGLEDHVILTGRREDVPAILRHCDVFVLPSDQEGLPGAVLEAMATGKPCVVSPPAAAAIEDETTGLVIPQNDPRALAAAVVRLLKDGSLATRLGQAARARVVARYSLDAMVQRYAELYEGLLTATGRAAAGGRASP